MLRRVNHKFPFFSSLLYYKKLMELYLINKEVQKALEIDDQEQREYQLSQLNLSLKEKTEELVKEIRNHETTALAIKDEIKRLEALEGYNILKAESIKQHILKNLELNKIKSIDFETFKVRVKKNPPKINIENEENLPEEYFRIKEVKSVNKLKLKDDLKSGILVDGVSLIQSNKLDIE